MGRGAQSRRGSRADPGGGGCGGGGGHPLRPGSAPPNFCVAPPYFCQKCFNVKLVPLGGGGGAASEVLPLQKGGQKES